MNWQDYFLLMANLVSLRSKDNSTKIGAVIVGKNNQIISTGYNSFPRGIVDDKPERQERPEKYLWMVHAEENAILNATLNGVSTEGAKIYMSCGIPCTGCAKSIINAGISEIICKQDSYTQPKWEEEAKRSIQMFEEAGRKVIYYQSIDPLATKQLINLLNTTL